MVKRQRHLISAFSVILIEGCLQKRIHITLTGKVNHILVDFHHVRPLQGFLYAAAKNLRHVFDDLFGIVHLSPENLFSLHFKVALNQNQLLASCRDPASGFNDILLRLLRRGNHTRVLVI